MAVLFFTLPNVTDLIVSKSELVYQSGEFWTEDVVGADHLGGSVWVNC